MCCPDTFQFRYVAKNHFILKHARNSIYCSICDIPITAYKYVEYIEHYRQTHPNVNPVDNLKPKVEYDSGDFSVYIDWTDLEFGKII